MAGQIIFFALILVSASISVWFAIRVKRHPEKDRNMKRIKAEQRGAEYEEGMRKIFFADYLITGVLWILTILLDVFCGIKGLYMIMILSFPACLSLIILRWRYTGAINKWSFAVLAILLSLIVVYHIWLTKDSKVEVLANEFSIEGNYGLSMPYQGIDSVFVVDGLPSTRHCKDGHSILGTKKGEFRMEDGSDAKFYLLGKKSPYLKMYTQTGVIFVNRKTAAETEQLIEELKPIIGEKLVTL